VRNKGNIPKNQHPLRPGYTPRSPAVPSNQSRRTTLGAQQALHSGSQVTFLGSFSSGVVYEVRRDSWRCYYL